MSKVITGQCTVVTSGVAVPLGTGNINEALTIKASSSNTGIIYIGNNGSNTISSTTGFILAAGELMVFEEVGLLSSIYVNASVNNQVVCWAVSEA